ncbi:hypothetical protein B0H17DRAFT_612543 [Mycena rosella]|uniref:PHD-type domain-containing protein n=1 Tax=Mycena rosella TaxID=1033263 RepID=A0AAD7GVP7_MYCRO|nr:hypothetical protein B0H17DRAFT_612543 [Mycena rosella]
MSRRLDISSLLCDEPPPPPPSKDPDRSFQVVAETVVLAPHLRNNNPPRTEQPRTEQSLDALAHAAALAEKRRMLPDHRPEPPFTRTPPQIVRSPIEDLHRPRPLPHYAPMLPPSRHVLEQQQQQQQHQHHLRLLQHHQQQQEAQQSARQREHHEQMLQQERAHQAHHHHHHWDRERVVDALGLAPIPDLRPGRKSDPGQLRPLTSPAPGPSSMHHLPPSHTQMEPPSKKRRYSDSPGPHPPLSNGFDWERAISLNRGGERSILNPEPRAELPSPVLPAIRRPSSSSGPDVAQFNFSHRQRKSLEVAEEMHGVGGPSDSRVQSPPFPQGRRSPPGSLTGRAKAARKSDPDEPDVSPYLAERRDYTTVIHVPERPREEYPPVEERKHKKSHSQGQQPHPLRPLDYTPVAGPSRRPEPPQEVRGHGPPQRRPQPAQPPRQLKEEDAHEWLLEHFADPSPDAQSRRKPEPPVPLSPLLTTPMTHVFVPPHTKRDISPLVPATMPEAAVALEEELASVHVPPASKSEPPDDEMDVDRAVSELVKEGGEGLMEVDVEDELLSLVDDQPRSRSVTGPPGISRVPSSGKPALRLQSATESESRHGSPMVSAASPPSFFSPARASSMLPPSERGSMPPPASTATGQGKNKEGAMPQKKKEATKPAPKPKAATAAKPRARPAPKPKAKPSDGAVAGAAKAKAPSAISRKSGSAAASASRSRSTSVMPGGSVGPEGSEKPEDEDEDALVAAAQDDKLYCVCKTKYDEDRFMIACDKCDEWYHTQCVDMPDLVVDLVDQFFCPLCIEKNPTLSLKTTYKPRCRYGLDHPEPDSPKACHKPAQGAFSKYCSPECGLNNISERIETFKKNGGKTELLWDSVKDAQKREAVVIVHEEVVGATKENTDAPVPAVTPRVKPPKMGRVEREVASLNAVLDEVVTLREDLKEGMEIVFWRERLLELASERAEQVGQCGWDQRLCFGEDEWADFGAGVLESYEEGAKEGGMQVDAEEWWCLESGHCQRHAGWQTIRSRDVAKEKDKKEEALFRLTTRERELRKRIDDLVEPFNRSCIDPSTAAPLKSSKLVNGNSKGKTNGDSKKGKKRKNPS